MHDLAMDEIDNLKKERDYWRDQFVLEKQMRKDSDDRYEETNQRRLETVAMCEHIKGSLEAARKAAFMPPDYPGGLANYITNDVWPSPRSEDIEKIQVLNGQATNLAMLVRRLLRRLRDTGHALDLCDQADKYLKDNGLEGSILR